MRLFKQPLRNFLVDNGILDADKILRPLVAENQSSEDQTIEPLEGA